MCRRVQVYSPRRGAWLVFSRVLAPEGAGDSWSFTAILQKDVELVKGYQPTVRPGACQRTSELLPGCFTCAGNPDTGLPVQESAAHLWDLTMSILPS